VNDASRRRVPEDVLPLSPIALQVLLAIADGDKHGYAILKEIDRRTDGQIALGTSSLYAVLKRLLAEGLVEEALERPAPALDDERRRYFRLTAFGRRAVIAELKRLETVLAHGRAKRLLFGRG
jgi:DNA-binding PadR family transcriptional regulator